MKKLVLLIVFLVLSSQQSTKESPNLLGTFIEFETTGPDFETSHFFSLDNIEDKLKNE